MFARWQFVRLNAAEKALRQGRIDDALAAVQEPELRASPRGQRLVDELVKPLLSRARLHRQAGRYPDALADLDRLVAIGRPDPEAQDLRRRILAEMNQGAQRTAEERQAYQQASDQLQAGRLDTVRLNLERIDDTRKREQLAEELDHRVQRGGQLLEQAVEALERDDVLAAARFWMEACRRGRTAETDRLAPRLAAACRQAVERWHGQGRFEGLLAARDAINALLAHDPTLADCERVVDLCTRAANQLALAEYAALRQSLLRLKAVRGDVAWITACLAALTKIAEGQEALMASPLGLYANLDSTRAAAAEPGHAAVAPPLAARGGARPGRAVLTGLDAGDAGTAARLERPLLLLVDGGSGSAVLVSRDLVRLGRAGTKSEIDVPLEAEVDSHHADIIRRGEDYFLTAYAPTEVNQRRVTQTLLRDGDRIVLGGAAKMTFHKPSAKSESAVLRLSHRCRLAQDVSDVVLFRDTCLVGAGETCHVRTRDDNGQVVLFGRGGGLFARPMDKGLGGPTRRAQAVAAGGTLEFDGLRVTVKPYTIGPGAA
jgi:tetratricopeptide (TPR) repeat protein